MTILCLGREQHHWKLVPGYADAFRRWRPFAPSLKKEAAPHYLESAYDSPFMILTAQVRPEKRSVIPSVTHVDGSARPQTVEREVNPLYYGLTNSAPSPASLLS
jgi:predicted NodU family carbamoyl transferase